MTSDPEIHDDALEQFLKAQHAAEERRSMFNRLAASRRFQFTLARMLASLVPLAMASLFLHYALRFPAKALVAIAMSTICLGWAAAIFFRNMDLVLFAPVCLVVLFVLLFVGA